MISISLGAQFRGGKAAPLFILLAFLILVEVFFIVSGQDIIQALVLGVVIVLLVFFMLDIQGVEIDKNKNQLRKYKLYPWGKRGKWEDFSPYQEIQLVKDHFKVKHRTLFNEAASLRSYENSHAVVSETHFFINLVHKNDPNKKVPIGEEHNYVKARKTAIDLSEKLDLPLDDQFIDKYKSMKARRGRR